MCCREVVASGKISHNEKLGVFTVEGTGGNAHCVRIFPKESCSCPSSSTCYHILAVKISIGLEVTNSKPKRINFSVLRIKNRSKKDKTSGQKKPNIADYDVVPTPDSVANVS